MKQVSDILNEANYLRKAYRTVMKPYLKRQLRQKMKDYGYKLKINPIKLSNDSLKSTLNRMNLKHTDRLDRMDKMFANALLKLSRNKKDRNDILHDQDENMKKTRIKRAELMKEKEHLDNEINKETHKIERQAQWVHGTKKGLGGKSIA